MHIHVLYSEEDTGFIAVSNDYPGMSAWGETQEAAEAEIKKLAEDCGDLWDENN